MAEHTSKRVATVYAEALYEAAGGAGVAEAVRADVESLQGTFRQYPGFAQVLAAAKIDAAEREKILRRTFEGRVGQLMLNFLLVLNQRWRLGSLPGILDEYVQLDNSRRLKQRDVQVVSAGELDEPTLAKIRQTVAAWGGFEPVLHLKQDPSLLAGLVLQIGDRQIDASIAGQLERLRKQMKKQFETTVTEPV